ncbi:hypothetical protein [Ferrimonas aestuarii]|uniref:Cytochrome P460 domain-containing protein n=1 Tax=Ferrimonas aestuarii TaxID=2569539 RepID=A0A4U1BSK1_9GAMM|nr:hypothetical protein [Ferrimonas aestuarii]TKB58677.1 hypothetical protein FCL42_02720 [Ferrimonas aestuarii]
MKSLMTLALGALISVSGVAAELEVNAEDFQCITDMTPVRGFYVDNLIEGKLADTVAIAEAEQGVYPPGSVVQLVPTEVMVKHPKGFSAATNDWEFFELNVSPEGSVIHKRGFVDVENRFGGNCFACHIKAEPKYDFVCESDHGCDPIPLSLEVKRLLQKLDPRCEIKYQPTPEEMDALQKFRASLTANRG